MIPCLCRDDKNKPLSIPSSKWVVEGKEYTVTYVYAMDLQNGILGVVLKEIDLESTAQQTGYMCFKMDRFLFKEEDIQKLLELMKDCHEIGKMDFNELLEINKVTEKEEELILN